jgi:DNA-binding MarR family transcriptional regulator
VPSRRPRTPHSAAGRAVARLSRLVDAALRPSGVSLPHYRLLSFLADGVHAPTQLADQLTISRAGVSSLIDRLEQQGLVTRTPHERDGRRQSCHLTEEGRELLAGLEGAIDVRLRSVAVHLDAEDRAVAYQGLALWNVAIERAHQAQRS